MIAPDALIEARRRARAQFDEMMAPVRTACWKAREDALIYGAGYVRINADGTVDHLDPAAIRVVP